LNVTKIIFINENNEKLSFFNENEKMILAVYQIFVSLHLMNNTVFISLELPGGVDALYDIYL